MALFRLSSEVLLAQNLDSVYLPVDRRCCDQVCSAFLTTHYQNCIPGEVKIADRIDFIFMKFRSHGRMKCHFDENWILGMPLCFCMSTIVLDQLSGLSRPGFVCGDAVDEHILRIALSSCVLASPSDKKCRLFKMQSTCGWSMKNRGKVWLMSTRWIDLLIRTSSS